MMPKLELWGAVGRKSLLWLLKWMFDQEKLIIRRIGQRENLSVNVMFTWFVVRHDSRQTVRYLCIDLPQLQFVLNRHQTSCLDRSMYSNTRRHGVRTKSPIAPRRNHIELVLICRLFFRTSKNLSKELYSIVPWPMNIWLRAKALKSCFLLAKWGLQTRFKCKMFIDHPRWPLPLIEIGFEITQEACAKGHERNGWINVLLRCSR